MIDYPVKLDRYLLISSLSDCFFAVLLLVVKISKYFYNKYSGPSTAYPTEFYFHNYVE